MINKSRGISLLETLITMAVLSFGLVAMVKMQTYLIGHSSLAKQHAEAITLAQKQIEELRDFQQITSANAIKAYNDITDGAQNISISSTDFAMNWTVTTNTNPDHKIVAVTINWTDHHNDNQNVTLTSIISKMDPAAEGVVMGASSGAGTIQP